MELGQLFILDIFLWTDFEECTVNDDIEKTIDYSKLVQILKDQSKKIYCFTIEKYSMPMLSRCGVIEEKILELFQRP